MATSIIRFNGSQPIKLKIGTVGALLAPKITLTIGNTVVHTSDKLPAGQDYYNWTVSESEKALIISLMPYNETSIKGVMKREMTGTVTSITYTKEFDVTFELSATDETKPAISITHTSPDNYADYVQSKTKLKCTIEAAPKYNATITNVTLNVKGNACTLVSSGDGTYEFESGLLFYSGDNAVVATVTDSRGFTRTVTDTIYVYPYAPPLLTSLSSENGVVCKRFDPTTNMVNEMYGTQCQVKLGVSVSYIPNVLTQYSIYYRSRPAGSSEWSSGILIGTNTIEKSGLDVFEGIISDDTIEEDNGMLVGKFSTDIEYDIELGVLDDLGGTHTRYEILPCQETSFHIKANGMGVSVGKYATADKTFDSAWDIHSDKDIKSENALIGKVLVLNGVEITATAEDLNNTSKSRGNFQTQISQLISDVGSYGKDLSIAESNISDLQDDIRNIYNILNNL